ncbi:helix-turn-helix domain-containing protein [Pseudomonas sp. PA-7-1E]|nr:helix-turn-helix domain-containing protein [Pseudomonas sp. PA-7-1E]MCF5131483.1 helix-turn-helix domain-containing protein [Pseudomonas sp. PA-6-4F]
MSISMTASIITEAREKQGLNQSELARRLGVTPQAVQAWESGRSLPRPKKLVEIAKVLQIPSHQLLTASGLLSGPFPEVLRRLGLEPGAGEAVMQGEISVWDDETPLEPDEVFVPLLREVELSAGSGRFAIEESSASNLRFFKKDLRQNNVQFNNAKCVMVSGNSMFPVLRDGATVGVNVGKTSISDIVDGEMYALNHNGQLRIKQVYRLPNGIRLRSFNRDDHPDEDYSFQDVQDEQISIIGHVFWWGMFSR